MQAEQLNKLIADPSKLNNDTVNDLKVLTEDFPSFQMGWLLYLKNLKQIKSPLFDEVLKKVAVRVNNRKMLFKFLNTNYHKIHNVPVDKPAVSVFGSETENIQGDSLIDKFLSSNPGRIGQNTQEPETSSEVNVNKILENSDAVPDDIITETLAEIYFQQKNYVKAQDAYRRLSLKYPEKSVYFATRIKEIEELKNI